MTPGTGTSGVIDLDLQRRGVDGRVSGQGPDKVEQFTITLDDGNGGTVDRTIVVTITGTNDAPVVAAADVTGAVTEQVTPVGNLTDSGTIAFTDVDLTDTHSIGPTDHGVRRRAGLADGQREHRTPATALAASSTWNYSVAASAVEYLAKDQTKVEQFTITLDDGNGGTSTARSTSPSPAPTTRRSWRRRM